MWVNWAGSYEEALHLRYLSSARRLSATAITPKSARSHASSTSSDDEDDDHDDRNSDVETALQRMRDTRQQRGLSPSQVHSNSVWIVPLCTIINISSALLCIVSIFFTIYCVVSCMHCDPLNVKCVPCSSQLNFW